MKWLYDGHLGTIYSTDYRQSIEECYCETCRDCDQCLGTFNNPKDWWFLVKDKCDIGGCGGYDLQYIFVIFSMEFDDIICDIKYRNYNEQAQGICCNTEEDILNQIDKIIRGQVILPRIILWLFLILLYSFQSCINY